MKFSTIAKVSGVVAGTGVAATSTGFWLNSEQKLKNVTLNRDDQEVRTAKEITELKKENERLEKALDEREDAILSRLETQYKASVVVPVVTQNTNLKQEKEKLITERDYLLAQQTKLTADFNALKTVAEAQDKELVIFKKVDDKSYANFGCRFAKVIKDTKANWNNYYPKVKVEGALSWEGIFLNVPKNGTIDNSEAKSDMNDWYKFCNIT